MPGSARESTRGLEGGSGGSDAVTEVESYQLTAEDLAEIEAGKTLDGARAQITKALADRAHHGGLDAVTDELERWSIEQLLQREYHGRFLFELIQNSVDAFHRQYPDRNDGLLRITLDAERLVVANEGEYLSPWVVIHSLSKVGQSTKPEGSSIGHKGIGFKSALEVSLTPRIYSRSDTSGPLTLRVRYDPQEALELVRCHTEDPGWDELVRRAGHRLGVPRDPENIPVLRFPMWDEDLPEWVRDAQAYDGRHFNTLLVLEHDPSHDARLKFTEVPWIERVRKAAAELTDEVILLLGSLGTIVLEGFDDQGPRVIEREVVRAERIEDHGGLVASEVVLRTNGLETSRWLRFDRLAGDGPISTETVAALRVSRDETTGRLTPLPPSGQASSDLASLQPADCFHLYFPTRIPAGLPLLLHAYFKVDAGRTKFAPDEEKANQERLDDLRALALDAISWFVSSPQGWLLDPTGLPDLFARAVADTGRASGDQELAVGFREALLSCLDALPWIPAVGPDGDMALVTLERILVDGREPIDGRLRAAFDRSYPARLGAGCFPDERIGAAALGFLGERRRRLHGDGAQFLDRLLRPGDVEPWLGEPEDADRAFVGLLTLLDTWVALDRQAASSALAGLAGDEAARVIPVIGADGGRRRRYPTRVDPGKEATDGLVLARVADIDQEMPTPPEGLRVSFIREGVLSSDHFGPAAELLGIRRFDTDAVLDAIVALIALDEPRADPLDIVRFAWRVLERSDGVFGVPAAMLLLDDFVPDQVVWFKPGTPRTDLEIRHAKGLAKLRLPRRGLSRRGEPQVRPAERLVFGSDWADALAAMEPIEGSATAQRVAAYRDLDAAAPDASWKVASPEIIAELLLGRAATDEDLLRIHAFLLRLGVWEVPPVEGFADRTARPVDQRDPWPGLPRREAHRQIADAADPEFQARNHRAIHVERDYRLLWEPTSDPQMLRSLARGVALYEACSQIRIFCSGCARHGRTPASSSPRAESYLAYSLRQQPWLQVSRHGVDLAQLAAPAEAWYEPSAPSMPGLLQSPYRYVRRGPDALSPALARFLSMESLDGATSEAVKRLLLELREEFQDPALTGELRGGTEVGRTLVGLHRVCYQRLHRCAEGIAVDIAKQTLVLAGSGPQLRWVTPEVARHDDGKHPVFKGLFSRGEVWFIVLKQDQTAIRNSLGVRPFEVTITKDVHGEIRDVTEMARPFVHDLAAEYLSLLIFHSVGGPTMELDSEEFRSRAKRLLALAVRRVDGLALEVQVNQIGVVTRIGDRSSEDVYVEGPTTATPVLFHDLRGDDWPNALQGLIGPHIANILGSDAYAATFQLLLLQPAGQRSRFLLDLGIGDEEVDQVRSALGRATEAAQAEGRRWRDAVSSLLGFRGATAWPEGKWRDRVSARLGRAAERLLAAGDSTAVRSDDRRDGALAVLQQAGIDLADLDLKLRQLDPSDGLRIDVAGARLLEWRRHHAREVVAVLERHGGFPSDVTARPAYWRAPVGSRLQLDPPPEMWLAQVIADLESVDIHPSASLLADPLECTGHLASLVGLTESELREFYEAISDGDGMRRLANEHLAQWRRVLRAPLTAVRSRPTDPPFLIREAAEAVAAELGRLPLDLAAFGEELPSMIDGNTGLADRLGELVRSADPLQAPPEAAVRSLVVEVIGGDLMDTVTRALVGSTPEAVQEVRRLMRDLQAHQVEPTPVPGLKRIPLPSSPLLEASGASRRSINRPPRKHDQNARDKAGRDAEMLVVASVIDQLMRLDPPDLASAIESMLGAMRANFDDTGMRETEAAAATALLPMGDPDDVIAALRSLVHVSPRSDQFGFDVLGWLRADSGDEAPSPVFLEVKSTSTPEGGRRAIKVSRHEWDVATDPRSAPYYAFCLVGRSPDGVPALELLARPAFIQSPEELRVDTDSWVISYAVGASGA